MVRKIGLSEPLDSQDKFQIKRIIIETIKIVDENIAFANSILCAETRSNFKTFKKYINNLN